MSIPLIQDNQKDSINASLIAIKREEERLQALIAEADKKIAQLNELKVNKSDIVDEVTLNNMQSVTSNAVASELSNPSLKYGTFGVLGGAHGLDGNYSLQDLWNILCGTTYDWGKGIGGIVGGSVVITDQRLGWCNFLYIPHRTGIDRDNYTYGTLLLFPMVRQGTWIRMCQNNGSTFIFTRTI